MPPPPAPPTLAMICLSCFYSLSSLGQLGQWAGKCFSALRLPTPTAEAWKICWLYFWRETRQEWFLVFYHSTCYHKDGSSSDVRIQFSVLFWFLLPLDTQQSVTSSPGSASVGGPQSPRTQTGCRLLDSVDCDFFLIQCGELPRVKRTVDVVHWSAFSTIKLLWSWFKDNPAMLGAVSSILEALYFFSWELSASDCCSFFHSLVGIFSLNCRRLSHVSDLQ